MIIISHRGASGYEPENTLPAFRKAVEMGAKAFEFDIHRTSDGRLVVHHDYDLKRTAGAERKIKNLSFDELREFNVGLHFGGKPVFAPSLEEVIKLISPAADLINIEIKNDGNEYPGIEEDLLKELAGREIFKKTVFSSFDFPTLKRLRAASPEARLAFLGHRLSTAILAPSVMKAKSLKCENFHLSSRIAFGFNLKILEKVGFKVCVYTVNEKKQALKFMKAGVYGIFSNFPDILEKE